MSKESAFAAALASIESKRKFKYRMSFWLDANRRIHLCEKEGQLAWFKTAAEAYELGAQVVLSNPKFDKKSRFYYLDAADWVRHKARISFLIQHDLPMARENQFLKEDAHIMFGNAQAQIAVFPPTRFVLTKMDEVLKTSGPENLLMLMAEAKKAINHESAPCQSCNTLCHIAGITDLPAAEKVKLIGVIEEDGCVCLSCGVRIISAVAEVKSKIFGLNLSNEITALRSFPIGVDDLTQEAFKKFQVVLTNVLNQISKGQVLTVASDKLESIKLEPKAIVPTPPTDPTQIPGYFN
ncbi:MAG: hypothetical protein ABFC56_07585 [Clostridiaceae bacterium]